MSAHTPGPWIFKKSGSQEWQIDAPNGDPTIGYSNWECMAICYGSDDFPEHGKTVGEANARLIASAPDLLAVLQQIHAHGYVTMDDYDMVAEAIAKATGVV
jgi:hypothetical protein